MSRAAQVLAAAAEKIRTALNTPHTEDRDEGEAAMSRLTEDLLDKDWTETTLANCQVGDEVVGICPRAVTGRVEEVGGFGVVVEGVRWIESAIVLRAPRPEPEPEPVFERGEVWWCRHNETGKEGSLVRSTASWRGIFSEWAASAWTENTVTPLRKLLNADGTAPQDLPEWDPEREWPLGTVVEATLDGVRMDGVRIEYVKADSSKPLSWCDGLGDWEHSNDLHNVRVLSVPGHPAPGPSLRERLLDEETEEAVAQIIGGAPIRETWEGRSEISKMIVRGYVRPYLKAAADVLDPEGEQA